MLFFEEPLEDSARGMMSLSANKPLHLPTTELKGTEFDDAFNSENRFPLEQSDVRTQPLILFRQSLILLLQRSHTNSFDVAFATGSRFFVEPALRTVCSSQIVSISNSNTAKPS